MSDQFDMKYRYIQTAYEYVLFQNKNRNVNHLYK